MRDLWIHDNDLIVATHGRSFWILDDIAPLREVSTLAGTHEAHLFSRPRPSASSATTTLDTPLPPTNPLAPIRPTAWP